MRDIKACMCHKFMSCGSTRLGPTILRLLYMVGLLDVQRHVFSFHKSFSSLLIGNVLYNDDCLVAFD